MMTETTVPATSRHLWPDWAKGLGILLVVIGHVWRGLMAAGLPIAPDLYQAVDRLIYAFHMPLFFLLSGLFFERGLLRQPVPGFLWSRVVSLLWPLAVWTWIFFFFKSATGALVNNPVPWSDFPLIPLPPREEFWFLWALFLVQAVLALVLRPVVRHPGLRNLGWLGAYGVAVLLALLTPGAGVIGPSWVGGAYRHASYFILGVLVSRQVLGRGWSGPPGLVPPLLGLVIFLGFEGLVLALPPSRAAGLLEGTGATLAVMMAVRAMAQFGAAERNLRWLAFVGARSSAIYVAHVEFTAAARIVLMKLGITAVSVHLVLATLAGVLGPLIVFAVLQRLRIAAWFGLRAA